MSAYRTNVAEPEPEPAPAKPRRGRGPFIVALTALAHVAVLSAAFASRGPIEKSAATPRAVPAPHRHRYVDTDDRDPAREVAMFCECSIDCTSCFPDQGYR